MRIKPFQAWMPAPEEAGEVSSPPYDVVSAEEASAMTRAHPRSFMRIIRSEVDLPEDQADHWAAVVSRAAENLQAFRRDGILRERPAPELFVYAQEFEGRRQYGTVCCGHVEDYEADRIRKHEKTREKKERERTEHMDTLGAHTGLVFLTYRDSEEINAAVEAIVRGAPLIEFVAEGGVRHIVWAVEEAGALVEAFARVPIAYVADGHHRAAAAAGVARLRRENKPEHTGDEEANWFLTGLFPASQLHILPYNRCVSDLNGLTSEDFLERVQSLFHVTPGDARTPDQAGCIHMYLDGKWHALEWESFEGDPVSVLDVSVLQDRLLAPVLGIDDPRTSDRIDFIGGIRGLAELERRVDDGEARVAFAMYPVSVESLMAISDAGLVMPPKSTWFEPKLRSGLFVHVFQ